MPRVGVEVSTPAGRGRVRRLDLLRAEVTVEIPGLDDRPVFTADQLAWGGDGDLPEPRRDRSPGRRTRGR